MWFSWKIFGTQLPCIFVLLSREYGPNSSWDLMHPGFQSVTYLSISIQTKTKYARIQALFIEGSLYG